eukprot:CAMPEP_0176189956 /NCGR_PEP_ID=MMETSP0121_2-20121125/3693_1 /TAXON_ID=160619 /ORGANISM="Kryptoperidinium foliaceum, Strain CCMP 1326" /LENGTH=46 /DNA_ID= /DNA_START= /DNA_END= /DNA_ORIENTATION=
MEGETCDATGTCARHADALQEARRCEAAPMSRTSCGWTPSSSAARS